MLCSNRGSALDDTQVYLQLCKWSVPVPCKGRKEALRVPAPGRETLTHCMSHQPMQVAFELTWIWCKHLFSEVALLKLHSDFLLSHLYLDLISLLRPSHLIYQPVYEKQGFHPSLTRWRTQAYTFIWQGPLLSRLECRQSKDSQFFRKGFPPVGTRDLVSLKQEW